MERPIKILICDDNIAVHESLKAYLHAEKMECGSAYDGEQALEMLKNERFDLLVLDVMMPRMFGTRVCKELRKTSEIPVVMLSARGEEEDRILGLELGADDYVVKPFSPREVVTRIKAILKRARPVDPSGSVRRVGGLTIDMDGYTVSVDGQTIELTPKEFEILACMAENKGKVLTREQLMSKVWGYEYCGDTRAVDTQIKRIRQKLPETGTGFEIKAVYGVGYKLEVAE